MDIHGLFMGKRNFSNVTTQCILSCASLALNFQSSFMFWIEVICFRHQHFSMCFMFWADFHTSPGMLPFRGGGNLVKRSKQATVGCLW